MLTPTEVYINIILNKSYLPHIVNQLRINYYFSSLHIYLISLYPLTSLYYVCVPWLYMFTQGSLSHQYLTLSILGEHTL